MRPRLKFFGIGAKIAVIPLLAIIALLMVNTVNSYLAAHIKASTVNGQRGAEIALQLTQQLLLATAYLADAKETRLFEIESKTKTINQLISGSKASSRSHDMDSQLVSLGHVLEKYKATFSEAVEIVRAIKKIKFALAATYRANDRLAEEIITIISELETELIMEGVYLSGARREFRASLKEYIGFTSASTLNINDLLSFSDEPHYKQAEKALKKKINLVISTCDNLSTVTGSDQDREVWLKIFKNQTLIENYHTQLYKLWLARQKLGQLVELSNREVQKRALDTVAEAKRDVEAITSQRKWISNVTILLTVVLLTIISALVIRSITHPLMRATDVMVELSKGRLLELKLSSAGRRDEIGQLEESFVRMITNTREIVEMASSLASGNYDITIKPRSDEDVLSQSLISMTGSLKELNEALEERSEHLELLVKQRTGELNKTVEELEAKNAELERFTYTVSHDLKSPLITIKGFVGALEKDIEADNYTRVGQDLKRIRNAGDKMESLLQDLLELSRIGRIVNPPVAVNFKELVDEAINLVAGQIKKASVRLSVADQMPLVHVDKIRLVEVLQNLIDNAVKFMGDQSQPRINIGVRSQTDEPVFYIEDNGVGIEDRYKEKIFGLFNQLSHDVDGTGIGLALVKRIIEIHNGKIWVESQGTGQGSRFCFTLGPVDAPPLEEII